MRVRGRSRFRARARARAEVRPGAVRFLTEMTHIVWRVRAMAMVRGLG